MPEKRVKMVSSPDLSGATLVMGFSGWMDGGEVSTGTINYLSDSFEMEELATIEPEDFYVYSFPGSMEVSALFRPECVVKNGVIAEYEPPTSVFSCAPKKGLVLFSGREPNMRWREYADCVLHVCSRVGISRVYFVGSVGGLTPHTREPRITTSASSDELRDRLVKVGIRPSNYEGPASFVTYLTLRATELGMSMATLVAELPAYVQGYNPKGVLTMVRLLGRLLDLHIDVDDLKALTKAYISKLNELVAEQEELAEKVEELEKQYDDEAFHHGMGDLREWLGQQGLRVD